MAVAVVWLVGCASSEMPEDPLVGSGEDQKADDPARGRQAAPSIATFTASCTEKRGAVAPTTVTYEDTALAKIVRSPKTRLARIALAHVPAEEIDVYLDGAGAGRRSMTVEVWPYADYGAERHTLEVQVSVAGGNLSASVHDTYVDVAPVGTSSAYFIYIDKTCTFSGPIDEAPGSAPTSRFPQVTIRTPGDHCLEVTPERRLRVAACTGASNQRWILTDTAQIAAAGGGCLVMRDSWAELGDCGGQAFRPWLGFQIRPASSQRCLATPDPSPSFAWCSTRPESTSRQEWRLTTWGSLLTWVGGADNDSCLIAGEQGALGHASFSPNHGRQGLCAPKQRWSWAEDGTLALDDRCLTGSENAASLAPCDGADQPQRYELGGAITYSRSLVGGGSGSWFLTAPGDALTVNYGGRGDFRWRFVP